MEILGIILLLVLLYVLYRVTDQATKNPDAPAQIAYLRWAYPYRVVK